MILSMTEELYSIQRVYYYYSKYLVKQTKTNLFDCRTRPLIPEISWFREDYSNILNIHSGISEVVESLTSESFTFESLPLARITVTTAVAKNTSTLGLTIFSVLWNSSEVFGI